MGRPTSSPSRVLSCHYVVRRVRSQREGRVRQGQERCTLRPLLRRIGLHCQVQRRQWYQRRGHGESHSYFEINKERTHLKTEIKSTATWERDKMREASPRSSSRCTRTASS